MKLKPIFLGVFFVIVCVFLGRGVSANEGNKVWSLRISGVNAYVEENQFSAGKSFPIHDIRIKRVENNTIVDANGRPSVDLKLFVAPLTIDPDGRINGQNNAVLSFADKAMQDRMVIKTSKAIYKVETNPDESGISAALKTGIKGPDVRKNAVAILDDGGNVVFEKNLERCSISDLYLNSEKNYLVYTKRYYKQDPRVVIMDTVTGIEKSLDDIPQGIRYYAADGSRFLVIQTGFGKAYFFDNSDPYNPTILWEYEAGNLLTSGAVCDDGSLAALQVLDSVNNPNNTKKRVVVLDETAHEVSAPIAAGSQVEMDGLQWEEKYLFVGTQHHPMPTTVHFRTTDKIEVFDFSL